MVIPVQISDGQYANGNDLSLTAQEIGAPTSSTVHCTVSDLNSLDCIWSTTSGKLLSFRLGRVAGQALSKDSKKLDGFYQGKNSDGRPVRLEFETLEDLQPGTTAIPQETIFGTILIDGIDFHFKGVQYDPATKVLVMDINGTFPIVINCRIVTLDKLKCIWSGTHGVKANDVFDLSKSER